MDQTAPLPSVPRQTTATTTTPKSSLKIARTGIHGFHETLGIDANEIRFFWTLEAVPGAGDDAPRQSAYEITVSKQKGPEKWEACWHSGRVESDAQRDVVCKSDGGFDSTTLYNWQLVVYDQNGLRAEADGSAPTGSFFTAYPKAASKRLPPYSMNQTYMPHSSLIYRVWFEDEFNRWKAVWIGGGGDKPIYLRRSFRLSRKPYKAVAFASGLGHFNLSVNGRPASRTHVLDPGWTNYHQSVQFVAYDVTDSLRAGDGEENVIGAHVGNGFYAGDKGEEDRFFWPLYEDIAYVRYGNELCFFAELHLLYEDGTQEVIISDPNTWKVRQSATTLANIYASEDHDRRQYPIGWDDAGFDDSGWAPAKPLSGPKGEIRYQSQPPVVVHETWKPVAQRTIRPGTVVFDLGQNASTMVKLELKGPAGSQVTVRYSETVGDDGAVLMPDPLFKMFETGVYSRITLAGTGEIETWQPDFSFTSARYIQVEGIHADNTNAGLPTVVSLVGQHVSSASRRLGPLLRTDKDDVNALASACYWTFSSNLFSYHTDCPQVEKFAWLEVTHLLAPTTQYIRDVEAIYAKICDDMRDAQDRDGFMPSTAPEMRYMPGPMRDTITWGGAICLLPALIKKYYGSTVVFARMYEPCKRYMQHMRGRERHGGGIIEHGIGDWGRKIAFGNHQANVETGIYYQCLRAVEDMARVLDLPAEAAHWAVEAERVRKAYNRLLLKTDQRDYPYAHYTSIDDNPTADPNGPRDRTMVAQALALQMDLCPAEHRADVERALIADAEEDTTMRAGEIGLRYLFTALSDLDRPDLVLAMARREEHPSYMRLLRRGGTTLPEFWQDACRSNCHDMLGTVYEWMHSAVLGLRPVGDAWRTWTLRLPYGSEFGLVEGKVDCPYGTVAVRFEKKGDGYEVQVSVPVGTTATVIFPREDSRAEITKGEGKTSMVGAKTELTPGSYVLVIG